MAMERVMSSCTTFTYCLLLTYSKLVNKNIKMPWKITIAYTILACKPFPQLFLKNGGVARGYPFRCFHFLAFILSPDLHLQTKQNSLEEKFLSSRLNCFHSVIVSLLIRQLSFPYTSFQRNFLLWSPHIFHMHQKYTIYPPQHLASHP